MIILLCVFLIEIISAAFLIFSITPLAEFVLNSDLKSPSPITEFMLDYFILMDIQPSFFSFASLFIIANFMKAGVETFTRFICLKVKYNIFVDLSNVNLKSILKSNWLFFSQIEQGKLINSFQKELSNISDTISQLAQQFAYLFQLIVYFSIPLWINPKLTLIAIGIAVVFMIPFLLLHKISFVLGKKTTETANKMTGSLYELFLSIRLIISHNKQSETIQNHILNTKTHSNIAVKSQTFLSASAYLFQPFTVLAAIIAIGVSNNINNNLSETAAVLWALMRAMPVLSKVLQANLNISNLLPSFNQLNDIVLQAKSFRSRTGKVKTNVINKSIVLSKVNFYHQNSAFYLKKIDMKIFANKVTGITGHSGSGKSTIIDLILGLQSITTGQLLIDDQPYKNVNLNYFRDHIGYVPQDPQLYNTSIRQNLKWFQSDITEQEMIEACLNANAMEFINKLPNKFDTIVGNNGTSLSGGQKQRITIARALLRKPNLLILDEATSSLDSKSDIFIRKAIERLKGKMTIIVVSHKRETLKNADFIYVIDNGMIVEKGTFNSLLEIKNIFYDLMYRQS
ncbi:ABC transporter ATP-binding protein/permease [Pseudomonadota bacterium]|nr:ABC transporter ATP-binding protein/permease [Pseudomonadota bacterium]